jgi:hypothetical protein
LKRSRGRLKEKMKISIGSKAAAGRHGNDFAGSGTGIEVTVR